MTQSLIQDLLIIGAAVAFSSTVLVFKAMSQWGLAEKPHGRRAIGILLFQDAALVPLLLLVPLLTGTGEKPGVIEYLTLAGTSVLFVVAVLMLRVIVSKWLIPRLTSYRGMTAAFKKGDHWAQADTAGANIFFNRT